MSFFSGGKAKDKQKEVKDMLGKKAQFYVEFLGWMESRGIRGRKYTDPVMQELKRRQKKMDTPPKLTIQLSNKELKISQELEEKRKRGIKKIKFPAIPARDVTYAVQATRSGDNKPDDIVACIYLGYMPRTQRYVHVHVYRFDEPSTASTFARFINSIVEANANRINEVERDLANKGEIEDPRLNSSDGMSEHTRTGTDSAAGSVSGSAYSENGSPTFGSDDMDADLQSLNDVQPFDDVATELKHRLKLADGPLLLPPKDYDTISRARGNLFDINDRRCMNLSIVGEGVVNSTQRLRNGSDESGIDLASPSSDNGDVTNRFPPLPPSQQFQLPPHPHAQHASGNNSPVTAGPQVGLADTDFVYPPRQDNNRVGGYPQAPGSPTMKHGHVRTPSSPYSTHSSRASRHSDGNNSGDRLPVYSRSNSNNSSNNNGSVQMLANGADFVPPTDYDDDSAEPVIMRPKHLFPDRPISGSGSPMLMRSMPASVLRSEMALHSPRNPRRPVDGDEYFFNAQRRSQPVYASYNNVDLRPGSADMMGQVPRRINSYR